MNTDGLFTEETPAERDMDLETLFIEAATIDQKKSELTREVHQKDV